MSRKAERREVVSRMALAVVRFLVLHLPDRSLARGMGTIKWITYVATGDAAAVSAVAEVQDIFASGPPYTDTVRKLIRNAEPEIVASAVRCLVRKSPFGDA